MNPSHWSIVPVTTGGTTGEPVWLDEVRTALRLADSVGEDAYLQTLIRAARTTLEAQYRQVFLKRQFDLYRDAAPCGPLTMPFAPLASVEAISGYDADNVETSVSSSEWYVDHASIPGRLLLNSGVSWPASLRAINGIRVRMTLGYSTSPEGVPDPIREAILQLVAFLYEHRGEAAGAFELPPQVAELMAMYDVPEVV